MSTMTDRDRPALLGGRPAFAAQLRITEPTLPPLWRLLPGLWGMWRRRSLTNNGPLVQDLADQLADMLAVASVVPTGSGTDGLVTALRALPVRGEVIVPALTFSATAHAVVLAGSLPIFADVSSSRWSLTPETIDPHVTPRTEAILPVHLFGQPCERPALEDYARRHNVALLFDAAQAFGSRYADGCLVGGGGDAEVFSFHATKMLPTGEGGAIATADGDLARRCRLIIRFGDPGDGHARMVGLNGKMTEFSALLALHGLPRLKGMIARRVRLVERYRAGLAGLPGLVWREVASGDQTNHQLLALLVQADSFGLSADELAQALRAEGIDARRYYSPPLHRHEAFAASPPIHLAVAERLADELLCLPLTSHMRMAQIDRVCEAIRRIHRWRDAVRRRCSGA